MNVKRLRRWCLDQLSDLDIPAPCDIATLCEHVGRQRQRVIHLVPVTLRRPQTCGAWVATATADFIFYVAETSKAHRDHIIAHELAHVVSGHQSSHELSDTEARQLFPDIDPELVRNMLWRTGYSDAIEQEAEMMAYLIRAALGGLVALPSPGMLGALETAMGYRHSPFS